MVSINKKRFVLFFLLQHLVNCEERSGGLICGGSLVLSFFVTELLFNGWYLPDLLLFFQHLVNCEERTRGG